MEYSRPEKTQRHFMGFLVLAPEQPVPGRHTIYHLIDGQQRLTTLSLILCALRDLARIHSHADLAAEIEETYLVHRFKKSAAERYRLNPKQRDRADYFAAVDHEAPGGRIGDALRFFAARVGAVLDGSDETPLRAMLSLISGRLEFVHATLEPGENPYDIFKGLNSTGVPLGPADLIRNAPKPRQPPASPAQTVHRWLLGPVFLTALHQARCLAWTEVTGELHAQGLHAVRTLAAVLDCDQPRARVLAARTLLELFGKAIELENLNGRAALIEAELEAKLNPNGGGGAHPNSSTGCASTKGAPAPSAPSAQISANLRPSASICVQRRHPAGRRTSDGGDLHSIPSCKSLSIR